ncbi:hypothetical protein LCGC14_2220240 [marine sediment metagenome]|uniref:ParB/Sulfiredoxin domain-containing protein n=1 Tax=marine sediment metagenome TaxID=412755 RepID=A0A0F9G6T5_9ZZZZ
MGCIKMVEKTSGWNENKSTTLIGKKSIVGRVLLSQIALNPEERLRLESGNFKDLPKYIGIKSTMEMFGQYHTITLRRKGNKDYLLGGFLRFCIAVELGWKEIGAKTYFDLSDYEAIIIEITENTNRIDFTSYEVIMAIGKAKTEWERLHPNTGRGKYNRSQLKNETISDGESLMQLQNHQDIPGFVKENYKILGISKRSLYRRVQLFKAIQNNIFDEVTLNSFKNDKITYSQLLNKLRKIENKRKIRNNKEASKTFRLKISPPSIKQKKKTEERTNSNSSNLMFDVKKKIDIMPDDNLEKVEKINEASRVDLLVKEQYVKVKKQKVSLNKGYENTLKIEEVKKSVKEGIISNFENAGKKYEKKKNKNSKEAQDVAKNNGTNKKKESSIKKMYICMRCPKATVLAVPCECEECGHPNFATTVLCDVDMINGFHKLRSPNSVLCEKSPDYDLILKKVF